MNLKSALLVLALSLPLAGCGNKGPLVLPQDPPSAESTLLPSLPPMDDATVPVDTVPAPPPPPADDTEVAPPPAAAGDDGNG